jgi:putative protein-disulfide isomerase
VSVRANQAANKDEQDAMLSNRQVEGTDGTVEETTVFVEYYTDPLCSWSWAFEAQWRRLRYEYGSRLSWQYRMGGLIADWRNYEDPLNDVRLPAQMGPQWFQVRELTGMPLDERIWQEDPPSSSYPACVAVKAAQRQGQVEAEAFLRRLREAVMMERRNIARQDVLLAIAEETAGESNLDLDLFRNDLPAPETLDAFRQDLRDAGYYNIGRFPTLLLHRNNGHGLILVGYRPYELLCEAVEHLAPGLRQSISRTRLPPEELAVAYVSRWGRVTARELAEVTDVEVAQVSQLLNSLVERELLAQASGFQSEIPIYIPVARS